jgi:predicted transcriptional regulator
MSPELVRLCDTVRTAGTRPRARARYTLALGDAERRLLALVVSFERQRTAKHLARCTGLDLRTTHDALDHLVTMGVLKLAAPASTKAKK